MISRGRLLKLAGDVGSIQARDRRILVLSGLLGVLGLLVVLLAILPAHAAEGAPSGNGVTPDVHNLGGQPDDCIADDAPDLPSHPDAVEFRIVNPVTGTFTDPVTGTDFALVVTDNEVFDFVATGNAPGFAADVADVIVKGGAKSTHYDYDGTIGTVSSDTGLHAPTKGGGKLFALSHVSFCYGDLQFAISGTKYHDHDMDGARDASFEEGESGFNIRIYSDNDNSSTLSAGDALLETVATTGDGSYSSSDYEQGNFIVCEETQANWAQSTNDADVCAFDGALEPDGAAVSLTQNTTVDFGNFRVVDLICDVGVPAPDNGTAGAPDATATLIDVAGCTDKLGVPFEVYDDGIKKIAHLGDIGTELVSLFISWPEEPRVIDAGGVTLIDPTVVVLPSGEVTVLPCGTGEPDATTPVCQALIVATSPAPGTTIQVDETISVLIDPPFFRF